MMLTSTRRLAGPPAVLRAHVPPSPPARSKPYQKALIRRCVTVRADEGDSNAVDTSQESKPSSSENGAPAQDKEPEVMFQVKTTTAELAIATALSATLVYLPLTLATFGRALWSEVTITDDRIIMKIDSPVRKESVSFGFDQIKEIRSANRAFGLWGDMVIFLKNGDRQEVYGVKEHQAIKLYIEGLIN